MTAIPRRRWFRFSLRGLLLAVTLLCAWFAWQVNWIRERHRLLVECPAYVGITSAADMALGDPLISKPSVPNAQPEQVQLIAAPWSLRHFGEPAIARICVNREQLSDCSEWWQRATRAFPEAEFEAYHLAPPR